MMRLHKIMLINYAILWTSDIDILTRSRSYTCLNPSYFIRFSKNGVMNPQKLKRMVTNVAKGSAKYKVLVKVPKSYEVAISPKTLVFSKKHEKRTYDVTIKYKGRGRPKFAFGALEWVGEYGHHNVRSPIMLVPHASDSNVVRSVAEL